MRHFEMINVFGKTVWLDISMLPRKVYISEDIPKVQRDRLYRLFEDSDVVVDHMLERLP